VILETIRLLNASARPQAAQGENRMQIEIKRCFF
jgi:hypothetical protein